MLPDDLNKWNEKDFKKMFDTINNNKKIKCQNNINISEIKENLNTINNVEDFLLKF